MAEFYIKGKFDAEYKNFLDDWGVRITEVRGVSEEKTKDYWSIKWAEENGVDVYVPNDRKVDSTTVEMRGIYVGASAITDIETMKAFLRGNGILHYMDDYRGIEFDCIYESYTPEVERYRDVDFVQFKLTFTKNVNQSVDTAFLDEHTPEDLEQLYQDILNSATTALNAAAAANAAAANAQEIADHPPIPQNGTWWVWDSDTDAYVDSGKPAILSVDVSYSQVSGEVTITFS